MKILGVIFIFIACYEANAESRLCGNSLNQAMLIICGPTGFNTMLKRSIGFPHAMDPSDISDSPDSLNALADIFLSDEANIFAKIRRRRDGIVDECCKLKGCSYNELYSYCRGTEEKSPE